MIGVSSVDSLFSKVKNDEKGTGEDQTLGRRRPNISEGENLVEKIDKSGFGEVKTLTSDVPILLIMMRTKLLLMMIIVMTLML